METLLSNPMRFAKESLANIAKYAFGKGIVTLGVMAATIMNPASIAWPVVAGFVGWKMFSLYSRYTGYKTRMIDLYRDDIARSVGCAPEAVTPAHLRMMAAGDPVMGIPPNPIIAEALERQRGSAFLSFITAMLSASTTLVLLSFGLNENAAGFIKEYLPNISDMVKNVGVSAISGLSGLILHNGLDAVVGQALGYFRATAHDRIALIAHRKSYGITITPQHVFDVFMATDPDLARIISQSFNKGFSGFSDKEKLQAMKAIGIDEAMKELADQINKNELKVGALAFELSELVGQHRKMQVESKANEKVHAPVLSTGLQAPASQAQPRFTDRFKPRSAEGSFVQQEETRRNASLQAAGHHL